MAAGGVRTLRVLIQPAPGTRTVWISVPSAEVLRGTVNGKALPEPNTPEKRKGWQLEFTAPTPDGIDLTVSLRVAGALSLRVTDVADGLPVVGGASPGPRPSSLMPLTIGAVRLLDAGDQDVPAAVGGKRSVPQSVSGR